MPSRKILAGDTLYVRCEALLVCSDALQVRIDSAIMCVTTWVPASECAKHEHIGELKPIVRRRWFYDR